MFNYNYHAAAGARVRLRNFPGALQLRYGGKQVGKLRQTEEINYTGT